MFPVAGRFIFLSCQIFMIVFAISKHIFVFSVSAAIYSNIVHVHCLLNFSLLDPPYAEARIALVCVLVLLGYYMRY